MELYRYETKPNLDKRRLVRDLTRYFPREILCSTIKDGGYVTKKSYDALSQYAYVRINSEDRISIIAIDIDAHQDGGAWRDWDIPEPTWTVWTRRGVQMAWILRKPILSRIWDHHRYARNVLRKIVHALDGDKDAMSFNRVFRNPIVAERARWSDTRVDLGDFAHLPDPPDAFIERKNWEREQLLSVDYAAMKEGDGRNCALFDRLRFFAYEQMRAGRYSDWLLEDMAWRWNTEFAEPQDDKAVLATVKSIDKYMCEVYDGRGKGDYMATTTPEERTEIARKNGKKGGRVTGKLKSADARSRILSVLNRFEMFEMKITVSAVAKMAKSNKATVSKYMEKLGYKNVGGSVGWKR